MGRTAFLYFSSLLFFACALLLSLNGCGSNSFTENVPPAGVIQHVVIIFQENRTPDNLFHDPVLIAHGADIAGSGLNSSGAAIPLTAVPLGVDYDLNHAHGGFVAMYNGGKMNGANNIAVFCHATTANCAPHPQFAYVRESDVAPYFQLAEQYTFGDRMFQTNQGPSFPAHQFIISGTSAPSVDSKLFVAENPQGYSNWFNDSGCIAPPSEVVNLIDPSGKEPGSIYPCFEHLTLTDELNSRGVSWRYYTPSAGVIWTAPTAIQHICGPNSAPPNATACIGSDWVDHVVLYTTQNPAPVLTDIANHQLPEVSWVIPSYQNSDHAGDPRNTGGPSWVASIVNAIGNSSYWSNTAIVITWDDWGGWYDHVPPPKIVNDGTSWGSGYAYGFRVPLIVVSPYAKARHISHVTHDFGSILNLIEKTFHLPSLGYADAYADDLSDCFDFTQTPLPFKPIAAPLSASHFLNERNPSVGPDDD